MADYNVDFRWECSGAVPVLIAVVSGDLLADPSTIPSIIDQAHALARQRKDNPTVYLAYDITRAVGRLPLDALMRRTNLSANVKRVAIIGVRARTDEMAVLIMGAAKQVPYEYGFFDSFDEAAPFLSAPKTAQNGS